MITPVEATAVYEARATRLAWVLGAIMITVAMASWAMRPHYHTEPYRKQLDALIPKEFGDWHVVPETVLQIDPTATADADRSDLGRLYDEVLMRTYASSNGEIIQLAIAYCRNQRQELKIHRPELCYIAQGFAIWQHTPTVFPIRNSHDEFIPGARMLAVAQDRTDAVSYWIRIGQSYALDPWVIRMHIFNRGLERKVDDGILVRVSQVVGATRISSRSYESQDTFIRELAESLTPKASALLTG